MSFFYGNRAGKNRDLRARRIREQVEIKSERPTSNVQHSTSNEMKRETNTALSDDDLMTFGKHQGQKLGEVPMKYWRWMIGEDWAQQWTGIFEYAKRKCGVK